MVAKRINLGPELEFETITKARNHFSVILNNTQIDQRVTSSEFDGLKRLYEAYCAKTDWPLPSPPKCFFPMYEKQKGFTTKCFGVEFENGKKDRFSLDKALSSVECPSFPQRQ